MLGSNKKDKDSKPFFEFPLEQDLKDETKTTKMIENVENQIKAIKKVVKEGSKPEEFENLGVLLHGYSALLKILNDSSSTDKKEEKN